MMNYNSSGYIRLLTRDEQYAHFERRHRSPPPPPEDPRQPTGMLWLRTRLNLGVEVRLCSLEHQILVTPIDPPAPAGWPSSAMFLYAETLFKSKDYKEFVAVMLAHPAAADMLLASDLRWRSGRRSGNQAKDLVRVAYAWQAAIAALKESEK